MITRRMFHHYGIMFLIMILSGFLSTMNAWIDKWDDIRLSVNDLYMVFLMGGWMLFFMGIYDKQYLIVTIGGFITLISLLCIRTQFMVTTNQYSSGMIPHHSMAIHMSRKLLEKGTPINSFVKNIIQTQEQEIQFLKQLGA